MRNEKVDTRSMLERGQDEAKANLTAPSVRDAELRRVLDYWPSDLIQSARNVAPPWRALVDPTRFRDVSPGEVHQFVREFAAEWGRWPKIDTLRAKFGRITNHRQPGEVEGQNALL